MLTISNVLTILCLLCLCGNRDDPGSFQIKSVTSFLKFSNERPSIFSSWPNLREKEGLFGVDKHRFIF